MSGPIDCGAAAVFLCHDRAKERVSDFTYDLSLLAGQVEVVLVHGSMLVDVWRTSYSRDKQYLRFIDLVMRDYLGTPIVQILTGVNKAPAQHGFDKTSNLNGVLGHEHFAEPVRLLKRVVATMKRLVVVLEDAQMCNPVVAMIKAAKLPPGMRIVAW